MHGPSVVVLRTMPRMGPAWFPPSLSPVRPNLHPFRARIAPSHAPRRAVSAAGSSITDRGPWSPITALRGNLKRRSRVRYVSIYLPISAGRSLTNGPWKRFATSWSRGDERYGRESRTYPLQGSTNAPTISRICAGAAWCGETHGRSGGHDASSRMLGPGVRSGGGWDNWACATVLSPCSGSRSPWSW